MLTLSYTLSFKTKFLQWPLRLFSSSSLLSLSSFLIIPLLCFSHTSPQGVSQLCLTYSCLRAFALALAFA